VRGHHGPDLADHGRHPRPRHLTHNPRLLPLVAHDRAGFGGALVSDGLGVLLASLWGYRAGARWLWWTLAGAGAPGFIAGIGVHAAVG
jgi:dihydroorotate dehydrogenase